MSIQHVALVLDCRDQRLSSARRMVLVALANRADADDICWPRQELIAEEAGMSVRSLQDHLAALVELGYLERKTEARGQGRGSKTFYRLITATLKSAGSESVNQEHLDTRNSAPELRHARFAGANSVGLDTRNTASQEPTVEPTEIYITREDEFARFWRLYPRKVNRANAERSFRKLKPLERVEAIERLPLFLPQWQARGVEFVPHASTWLNGKRWQDEPEPPDKPKASKPDRISSVLDEVFKEMGHG